MPFHILDLEWLSTLFARMTFHTILQHPPMHVLRLCHNVISSFEKEWNWVYNKRLNYMFRFLCKATFDNNKFIHLLACTPGGALFCQVEHHVRLKKIYFLHRNHQMGQNFINCFFTSRYTRYLLHSKKW